MNPFKWKWMQRRQRKERAELLDAFARAAQNFCLDHNDALVIIGDPHTDLIFMAHQGVVAPIRILNRDGSPNRIVANALKHMRGQADIDRFLLAVDGGLFTIAKALYDKRRASLSGKVIDFVAGEPEGPTQSKVALEDGSVMSPVQIIEKQ